MGACDSRKSDPEHIIIYGRSIGRCIGRSIGTGPAIYTDNLGIYASICAYTYLNTSVNTSVCINISAQAPTVALSAIKGALGVSICTCVLVKQVN